MIFGANLDQNSTRIGFTYTEWILLYSEVVRTIALIWYWKAKKISLDECIDNILLNSSVPFRFKYRIIILERQRSENWISSRYPLISWFLKTLCNVDNPEDCLVVSRWENRANWEVWFNSSERAEIQNKIDELTEEKTEYTFHAPMVPGQELR